MRSGMAISLSLLVAAGIVAPRSAEARGGKGDRTTGECKCAISAAAAQQFVDPNDATFDFTFTPVAEGNCDNCYIQFTYTLLSAAGGVKATSQTNTLPFQEAFENGVTLTKDMFPGAVEGDRIMVTVTMTCTCSEPVRPSPHPGGPVPTKEVVCCCDCASFLLPVFKKET